jgi:hypothetical protein
MLYLKQYGTIELSLNSSSPAFTIQYYQVLDDMWLSTKDKKLWTLNLGDTIMEPIQWASTAIKEKHTGWFCGKRQRWTICIGSNHSASTSFPVENYGSYKSIVVPGCFASCHFYLFLYSPMHISVEEMVSAHFDFCPLNSVLGSQPKKSSYAE